MPRFIRDVFLPPTDFYVFLEVAIVTPLWLLLLFLLRRNRDLFVFVLGVGTLGAGLTLLRAVH